MKLWAQKKRFHVAKGTGELGGSWLPEGLPGTEERKHRGALLRRRNNSGNRGLERQKRLQ